MVRIRLTRMGAKKRPFYRMVAADSRSPRDGRFLEQLGYYDPMREPMTIKLKLERIDHWLSVGARPSETAEKLIERARKLEAEAPADAAAPAKAPAKAAPPPAKAEDAPAAPADDTPVAEAPAADAPADEAPAADAKAEES